MAWLAINRNMKRNKYQHVAYHENMKMAIIIKYRQVNAVSHQKASSRIIAKISEINNSKMKISKAMKTAKHQNIIEEKYHIIKIARHAALACASASRNQKSAKR